jgi:hypothetical protein
VRYKIKATSDDQYQRIASELRGVTVYASSQRRRFFSTGDLPVAVRKRVTACGARVVEDRQYAPEAARR